jgi:hypothetical protein
MAAKADQQHARGDRERQGLRPVWVAQHGGIHRPVDARGACLGDPELAPASTQQRHGAVLRDVNDLKQQIERILDILDADRDASPAAWFWPTMSDQEREAKFSELYDWVETVLREQYPSYLADHIKPCWPNHPKPDGNSPGYTALDPHLPHQPVRPLARRLQAGALS